MKNIKEVIVLMCCLSLIFPAPIAFAAPQGGKVVGGSANIHQSGTTTTINQSSDRAIINWHSFDIGKNEAVRHNMPSPKSAGLHRVVGGGGASQIQGLLQSNGNIYLVNPAGVVIHKGARVDTNSFIATTRDIADSNFMKGKMVFDRPGRPGAQIINQGTISVKESGLAALVAPTVRNEGLIAGKLGKVALASGDSTWKLDMHGDDLITFTVNENDVNALHAADGTPLAGASVENSGSIKAEGGVVVLTAAQLDGIVGSVVNSGEVSAASAEVKGGKITFRGEGSHVDVRNTGIVDASSAKADGGVVRMVADGAVASSGAVAATGGQKGGKAVLTGRDVALTGTTKIDVSGNTGGGTALVGGNALGKGPERNARTAKVESGAVIHADAQIKGDGGQVVVWSDEKTTFDGAITAKGGREGGNGGMVETSGKILKVGDNARVETLAPKGLYGQWLLDPVDFVIAASGGDMTGATVSRNLGSGDMTILSSNGNSGTNGDIFVNDAISWSANTLLILNAERNVIVNADITATGVRAGLSILPQNGDFDLAGAKITLSGSDPRLSISGQQYTVINSIQSLQNINNNLSGYYALGSNIDASSTATWNNGEGFEPIGEQATYDDTSKSFKGIFHGLGHSITELTINRPNDDFVGLFGYLYDGAHISNIGLENVNISGGRFVGALAGSNGYNVSTQGVQKDYATIYRSFSSGSVSGTSDVGGLVGVNFGEISKSSSYANIKARVYGGGFAGKNYKNIYSSFSSGNVSGGAGLGGFVGNHLAPLSGSAIISNSYATGNVTGTGNHVGGFVGSIEFDGASILHSYSSGKVSGKNPGGFAGNSYASCQVLNSYWDINTSGLSNSVGSIQQPGQVGDGTVNWVLEGLTTANMVQKKSYNGWDFNNIWSIIEGKNYPQLINVATNNIGQSSTENVYTEPVVPILPTPPDTNGENAFDPDEYKRHIHEFLAKYNYEANKRQEEQKRIVEDFCKRINDDYFGLVFSEEGTATSLNILVNSYVEINFKYMLIEAVKKGVDVGTLLALGNWTELLQSLLTDVSLAEKVIRVILANNFLNGAKECYQMALDLYNQSGKKDKQKIIQIAEYLKNATELGFMGMILSEDIYNDMKGRVEFQSQHPILAFLSNIGEVSADAASSLSDALFGTMLGKNTAIKGVAADALDIYKTGQYRVDAIRNAVKLSKIQSITKIIYGGNDALEFIDGATGIYEMLTYSQKNKYRELSNPKVQQYNEIINMLNSLPDINISKVSAI